MLKIRLQRSGRRKRANYRIVVAEHSNPIQGRYVDLVGTYDPLVDKHGLVYDEAKILEWIKKGAKPTNTVARLLKGKGMNAMDPFIVEMKNKKVKNPKEVAEAPAPAAPAEAPAPAAEEKKEEKVEAEAPAPEAKKEEAKPEAPTEEKKDEAAPEVKEEKKEEAPAEAVKKEEAPAEEKEAKKEEASKSEEVKPEAPKDEKKAE